MNILHLKYAVEIAKTRSLNKAAESLYTGQPNLSRAIKELEASLGITIFDRSAKGMIPTPEGEQFIAYAQKILDQIDEVEEIYRSGVKVKQKFSISVPRASYIADAFTEMSKSMDTSSPAEFFYKETNALRAIKNIIEADYKLGIIRYAENYDKYFKSMLEDKNLIGEVITEFTYSLLMSASHPLAQNNNIRYDDLRSYTEIAHADPYVPSLSFAAVRKEELPDNIERRIYVFERASQYELLSENHDTFMWVSPTPPKVLDRYGLVQKPCRDNDRKYRDVLIYRKDYHLTDIDKMFITELTKAKRQYL